MRRNIPAVLLAPVLAAFAPSCEAAAQTLARTVKPAAGAVGLPLPRSAAIPTLPLHSPGLSAPLPAAAPAGVSETALTETALAEAAQGVMAAGTDDGKLGAALDSTFDLQQVAVSQDASAAAVAASAAGPEPLRRRLQDSRLQKALRGALLFLEDMQVRDRPGRRSSEYDSSDTGDGARSRLFINIPFTDLTLSIPAPPWARIRNKIGEWMSDIHFLPGLLGTRGRSVLSVPDSNSFMTSAIAFPLFLLQDPARAEGEGAITRMRRLAVENLSSFKRGAAYSFWSELPGTRSAATRVGPLNISVDFLDRLTIPTRHPVLGALFSFFTKGLAMPPFDWVRRVYDRKENPAGSDALFNVPNDADDTAMTLAIQALQAAERGPAAADPNASPLDIAALERIVAFRDIGRDKEDGRDQWKGKNSGAYLTWLHDESAPVFAQPQAGVLPLGVNNVDAVVNANVLLALGLAGKTEVEGYRSAVALLVKAIEQGVGGAAGLYYPQNMMFPYVASRAFRDGGTRDPSLRAALQRLLRDILDERDALAEAKPRDRGAFPGGRDASLDLSTALGVATLLNMGRELAAEIGEAKRYDRALGEGVDFLLNRGRPHKIRNPELRASSRATAYKWSSGLFFSASFQDLAQWRSRAYTAAIVIEALAKYLLGYDIGEGGLRDGRRLTISPDGLSLTASS